MKRRLFASLMSATGFGVAGFLAAFTGWKLQAWLLHFPSFLWFSVFFREELPVLAEFIGIAVLTAYALKKTRGKFGALLAKSIIVVIVAGLVDAAVFYMLLKHGLISPYSPWSGLASSLRLIFVCGVVISLGQVEFFGSEGQQLRQSLAVAWRILIAGGGATVSNLTLTLVPWSGFAYLFVKQGVAWLAFGLVYSLLLFYSRSRWFSVPWKEPTSEKDVSADRGSLRSFFLHTAESLTYR